MCAGGLVRREVRMRAIIHCCLNLLLGATENGKEIKRIQIQRKEKRQKEDFSSKA
jgi:hypothetical protein